MIDHDPPGVGCAAEIFNEGAEVTMHHLSFTWIYLGFVVLAILVTGAAFAWRRHRSHSKRNFACSLPDFAIVDCGDSIHIVPLERMDHRVDSTGPCQCGPVISINQRRRGTYVRYVDHRVVGGEPLIAPSVHTDGRHPKQHS